MRKSSPALLAAALLLVGAGCAPFEQAPSDQQEPQPTPAAEGDAVSEANVTLTAQSESGESGTVRLTSMTEGRTRVVISLANAPKDVPQPAHIHVGSCPNPGAISVPLTNVVNGTSETVINTSLASLLNATTALSINVHKSVTEPTVYVACGDLKK